MFGFSLTINTFFGEANNDIDRQSTQRDQMISDEYYVLDYKFTRAEAPIFM